MTREDVVLTSISGEELYRWHYFPDPFLAIKAFAVSFPRGNEGILRDIQAAYKLLKRYYRRNEVGN